MVILCFIIVAVLGLGVFAVSYFLEGLRRRRTGRSFLHLWHHPAARDTPGDPFEQWN